MVIQLVPYGRQHQNPPVLSEPGWDSPQTRDLAKRACFDCHSNQTVWPWYSNLAPVSWLTQRDVDEGRRKLNFSAWGQGEQEVGEIAEIINNGKMPPSYFLITHPEARLSAAEKQSLIKGLIASLGGGGGARGELNPPALSPTCQRCLSQMCLPSPLALETCCHPDRPRSAVPTAKHIKKIAFMTTFTSMLMFRLTFNDIDIVVKSQAEKAQTHLRLTPIYGQLIGFTYKHISSGDRFYPI